MRASASVSPVAVTATPPSRAVICTVAGGGCCCSSAFGAAAEAVMRAHARRMHTLLLRFGAAEMLETYLVQLTPPTGARKGRIMAAGNRSKLGQSKGLKKTLERSFDDFLSDVCRNVICVVCVTDWMIAERRI
jgi:hypothetical protein